MRSLSLVVGGLVAALAGCAGGVQVNTVVAPDASLAHLRSFRIMRAEPRLAGPVRDNNPILVNSITNRALRTDIAIGLQSRGFVETDSAPDFLVAYYGSTRQAIDFDAWNYGYFWRPRWGPFGPWGYGRAVTQLTEGSVVIDLVNPTTRQLLWRGHGVATVSDNPEKYTRDLQRTVTAILDKLPPPTA